MAAYWEFIGSYILGAVAPTNIFLGRLQLSTWLANKLSTAAFFLAGDAAKAR
jgi:hypothetical protein